MDKIEKIKDWLKPYLEDRVIRDEHEEGFFHCAMLLNDFLNTLSDEPDKVLEGEVILNGHGLLVDVTKWGNGYKLKVIIKED